MTCSNLITASLAMATLAIGRGQPAGIKRVDLTDSVLNMRAYSYSVPANWTFDGGIAPGSSCVTGATPFWRASSSDGLYGVKLLPRMDWSWTSRPIPGLPPTPDCLPFKQPIKARTFLGYMLPILGVQFVRDEADPEAADFDRQMQENTRQQRPLVWSGDRARLVARYDIGGRPVEELLQGMVMCKDAPVAYVQPPVHTYSCSAFLWRAHAPAGNLRNAIDMLKSITSSSSTNPEWAQRWNSLMIQSINAAYARQTAAALARGEQLNHILEARRKAFDQAQSMRAHQQQEFMDSMQRGADLNRARFEQQQYSKRQNAEDWCDYALDCTRSWDDRIRAGNCISRQTLPR